MALFKDIKTKAQSKQFWLTASGPFMAAAVYGVFTAYGLQAVSPALLIPLYMLVVAYSGSTGGRFPGFFSAFLASVHVNSLLFTLATYRAGTPLQVTEGTIAGAVFFVIAYIAERMHNRRSFTELEARFKQSEERYQMEFQQAQLTMEQQGLRDALTGLPNRKAFELRLSAEIARQRKPGELAAVMFLDLDNFKNINDTLGHDAGDTIFRDIAVRLRGAVAQHDSVARWGGDEFAVLLSQIPTSFEAGQWARRLLDAFEPPVYIGQRPVHVRASLGIAMFPHDGTDVQSLQKNADTAMYTAKDLGRNRFQYYNQKMNAKGIQRLALEHDLRIAVTKKEFRLLFQPIVDLQTGHVTAAEALLRWNHPVKGLLKPAEFLDVAEESGLIVELGHWAIQAAGMAQREWHDHNLSIKTVVNISARQFSEPEMVEKIMVLLRHADIAPKFFEVEITESVAMENIDRTRNKLQALKDFGVSITIDDFGTGYSSLKYLKSFAVDALKIDKSFVTHCITSAKDLSIVRAIISMAHGLGLKVVAEGVSSETQLSLLKSLGCDQAQGYFIGKPLASSQLQEWAAIQKASSSYGSAAEPVKMPAPEEAEKMVERLLNQ